MIQCIMHVRRKTTVLPRNLRQIGRIKCSNLCFVRIWILVLLSTTLSEALLLPSHVTSIRRVHATTFYGGKCSNYGWLLPPGSRSKRRPSRVKSQIDSPRSGNSQDDRDKSRQEKLQESLAHSWNQFKYGALRVHEHYLNILFQQTFRQASKAGILFSLVVPLLVGTSTGARVLHYLVQSCLLIEQVLGSFMNNVAAIPLIVLGVSFVIFGLFLPTVLVAKLLPPCDFRTNWVRTFQGIIRRVQHSARVSAVDRDLKWTLAQHLRSMSPLAIVFQFVLYGPVVEEIIFRQGLLRILRATLKENNDDNNGDDSRSDIKESKTVFGFSSWAFLSSLVFAMTHIMNWVRPLRGLSMAEYENRAFAARCLTSAVVQSTVSFFFSLKVLSPVFEERGLMASIGAHMTWNFCSVSRIFGIPLRLLFRVIRKFQKHRSVMEPLDADEAK